MRWLQAVMVGAVAVAGLAVSLAAPVVWANSSNLNGKWEIRSLGEFRQLEITQSGSKVEAYRVLWPEFQGEKYKLEHMYRGRITGTALKGQLYVREDGAGSYESLRPFTGSIETDGTVILDGMPIARHD